MSLPCKASLTRPIACQRSNTFSASTTASASCQGQAAALARAIALSKLGTLVLWSNPVDALDVSPVPPLLLLLMSNKSSPLKLGSSAFASAALASSISCNAVAREKHRDVNAFNFAAPSWVSGGFLSAPLAALNISASSFGTALTSKLVSSASAIRRSPSSSAASSAASAAFTASRKMKMLLIVVCVCPTDDAFAPDAKRSTSADMTTSRDILLLSEETSPWSIDPEPSPSASPSSSVELRSVSAPAADSFHSRIALAVFGSRMPLGPTSASTRFKASTANASRSARSITPLARRKLASKPAISTGTCKQLEVKAAANAEASAARASARISANIASASLALFFIPTPLVDVSAPTARASARASSNAT